jgi:hypothetical protein
MIIYISVKQQVYREQNISKFYNNYKLLFKIIWCALGRFRRGAGVTSERSGVRIPDEATLFIFYFFKLFKPNKH